MLPIPSDRRMGHDVENSTFWTATIKNAKNLVPKLIQRSKFNSRSTYDMIDYCNGLNSFARRWNT